MFRYHMNLGVAAWIILGAFYLSPWLLLCLLTGFLNPWRLSWKGGRMNIENQPDW